MYIGLAISISRYIFVIYYQLSEYQFHVAVSLIKCDINLYRKHNIITALTSSWYSDFYRTLSWSA